MVKKGETMQELRQAQENEGERKTSIDRVNSSAHIILYSIGKLSENQQKLNSSLHVHAVYMCKLHGLYSLHPL